MTPRGIAALICKALGLYAFLNTLNLLPHLFAPAIYSASTASAGGNGALAHYLAMANALPVLLCPLAGCVLWFGANRLARRMVQDPAASAQSLASSRDLETIAYSALGLFTLLQMLPRLAQMATNLYIISRQDPLVRPDYRNLTAPDIASVAVHLALGLWLMFGAAGLVKLLQPLRSLGVDRPGRAVIDSHP